jgi:hypothetical protein
MRVYLDLDYNESVNLRDALKLGSTVDMIRHLDRAIRETEDEMREQERLDFEERNAGPQTLADVGMCEADFR